MQDVFLGISVSGASKATCARSQYENFLCKMSVSRSPEQDPVGALVQDRCVRISCPRSPCPDLCTKILSYHLCKSSVCGSLAQDLSVRMSASGSSRTTSQDLCMRTSCPRSPCPDLCTKILSYHLCKSSVCGSQGHIPQMSPRDSWFCCPKC